MNKIVASLVVSCSSGTEGEHIVIELDDVLNDDETSFDSGDTIYIRVQHSSDVILNKVSSTDGTVFNNGDVERDEDDQILWIDTSEAQDLSYIPSGTLQGLWYGNTGSGLKKSGTKQVELTSVTSPALVRVDYSSTFKSFKLVAPTVDLTEFEDESYPIVIVADFGEA